MSNTAIRDEYAKIGVERFYELQGSDYRNPHEDIIRSLVSYAQASGVVGEKCLI